MCVFAEQVIERVQRVRASLRLVGPPVAALMEHGVKQSPRLKVTHQVRKRLVHGAQLGVIFRQQAAPERRPGFTAQPTGIFTQRCPLRHAGRQRRATQQRTKPTVECIDRHALRRFQHARIQPARRRDQQWGLTLVDSAGDQLTHNALIIRTGQLREDVQQALAHLFGCLACERNGENVRRCRTGQQQAQHARHQQPCLAAARAGLHHNRAQRITRSAREIFGGNGGAVAFVSVVIHACPSAGSRGAPSVQYPLRHRPRAAQ